MFSENDFLSSSSLFLILADSSPAAILIDDPAGLIRFVNNEFTRIFRTFAVDTLTGKNLFQVFNQYQGFISQPEELLAQFREIIKNRVVIKNQKILLTDGRTLEFDYSPFFEDGTYTGNLWQYRDQNEKKMAEKIIRKSHDELEIKILERTRELENVILVLSEEINNRKKIEAELRTALTEQKQAEQGLKESEELFRNAFDYAAIGMALLGTDGRFLKVNMSLCRMVGYSEGELMGITFPTITYPNDQEISNHHLKQLIHGYSPTTTFEKRYIHKEGYTVWTRINTTLHKDYSGKLLYLVSQIEDITAYKQAEEKWKVLFESTEDAILVSDFESAFFIEANPAACMLFGYTLDEFRELKGRNLHPSYVSNMVDRFAANLNKQGSDSYPSIPMLKKDGQIFWGNVMANVYEVTGQKLMVVIIRDITTKVLQEQALQESKEKYQQLFEKESDAIIVFDQESGIIEEANQSALKLLAYPKDQLLSLKEIDILADAKGAGVFKQPGSIPASTDKLIPVTDFRTKNGDIFTGEVSTGLFISQGKNKIIGTIRNVTARRELEEQLRQSQKMQALGRLVGGIAHDFNNLLMVILGRSQLLLMNQSLNDAMRKSVEEIKDTGERAAKLIQKLLAFSRKQVFQPEITDLNQIISSLLELLNHLLNEKCELTIGFANEPAMIMADKVQMEQLLINLVINARDAMPDGGRITIETTKEYLKHGFFNWQYEIPPGPYIALIISDTGIGMDDQVKSRIFEPFFTTKGKDKGTGLGLATVYGIVQQSSGSISVYSQPGWGSSFKIYFPEINETGRIYEDYQERTTHSDRPETVLLVEDEDAIRSLVTEMLVMAGYNVLTASNSTEALQVFNNTSDINLLITDIILPGINGRELADKIAEIRPGIKILYISGYFNDAISKEGVMEEGMNFLPKPFSPSVLINKVREMFGQNYN